MDMSKYQGMFLAEAREHLKNMGTLLIALEREPSDRKGIDSLFREAHSIKGMAASMGYERCVELAHRMEDLMDGFRRSGTVPPPAVDRLLEGVDLLEGLLEDVEAGRPERQVEAFLSSLADLRQDPQDASKPRGEGADFSLQGEGMRVEVELSAETPAPGARALLILRELSGLGTLLASRPTEEELRTGGGSRRLEFLLETERPAARVKERLSSMTDVERVTVDGGRKEKKPAPHPMRRREDASPTVRIRTDLLDRFINLTGELITSRNMIQAAFREERWEDAREGTDRMARLISDLQHHVLRVRMMPLERITGRLPRLVRDLSRKSGKEVRLLIEGETVELDRAILEMLADPLVHMVRNAVDHGIESAGEVTVRAWREKDLALLEVADNGRGMDPRTIRRSAVEKGLLTSERAAALGDGEALRLVCLPGFSTAARVSETSGRGVGMDVVKAAVESLGGSLDIASKPGVGTRIVLKFPLSVAIIQVLLVECDGHTFGIPTTRVQRTLEASREEVRRSGRQMVLMREEEELPLLSLRKILRLPPRAYPGSLPLVLTEVRGRKAALVVDRLVGVREAFVKTLEFPLNRHLGVSGATVAADGGIVFIIDPQALLEMRSGTPAGEPAGECI